MAKKDGFHTDITKPAITYYSGNNAVLSSTKTFLNTLLNTFRVVKIRNWRRPEYFVKGISYTIKSSLHVLPWLSCHDLAMMLP